MPESRVTPGSQVPPSNLQSRQGCSAAQPAEPAHKSKMIKTLSPRVESWDSQHEHVLKAFLFPGPRLQTKPTHHPDLAACV